VFVRTKFRTHKMAQQLAREGFLCTSIHGDRSQVRCIAHSNLEGQIFLEIYWKTLSKVFF
jgi:hypothetical protein